MRTFPFITAGHILEQFNEELQKHYESQNVPQERRTKVTRVTFYRLQKKLGFPGSEPGEWRKYSEEQSKEVLQKLREYYKID